MGSESILISVRKACGIDETDDSFDDELIMHTNSVLAIASRLGGGPPESFYIRDSSSVWSDLISNDPTLNFLKSYVGLKVKLIFDPPASSTMVEAMKQLISEFEWRITELSDSI